MYCFIIILLTFVSGTFCNIFGHDYYDYYLELTDNGPVVQGAEISFHAKLFKDGGFPVNDEFIFFWHDTAYYSHEKEVTTQNGEDSWNITYPSNRYPPGPYVMEVVVKKCFVLCIEYTSQRVEYVITAKLNGQLSMVQDIEHNYTKVDKYVGNLTPVNHSIELFPADYAFLKKNATSILTYWFVDCQYYGMTEDFIFTMKYDKVDSEHVIEAIVLANFEPITTLPPPTTTTTTTTSTTPSTTTSTTQKTTTTSKTTTHPTTTTVKPNITTPATKPLTDISTMKSEITTDVLKNGENILQINSNEIAKQRFQRSVSKIKNVKPLKIGANTSESCVNQSIIAMSPNNTYGYFAKKIIVKAPITNITVVGNNWLQHGDMLLLDAKCNGSPPFSYCFYYLNGSHNATGNETCAFVPFDDPTSCQFQIKRYFKFPSENTVMLVVKNAITTKSASVIVNVYKVTKIPQLSVIVVPVSFSIAAVILIVFGVAYYIQNRRRFTVEVANFDFGQQYSHLEYKTFRERLRDSITHALTRAPAEPTDQSLWPSNRKYGSMTNS